MDNKEPENGPGRKSPIQNILFWLCILVVPCYFIYSFQSNSSKVELSQSRFEAKIKAGKVSNLIIYTKPGSDSSMRVEGKRP